MNLSEKDIKRFWSKVDIRGENECWNWKASVETSGYGHMRVCSRGQRAHRIAWTIANGRAPSAGMEIAHKPIVCHNKLCCNPAHLDEKTRKENEADKALDGTLGRNLGDRNGSRTHPESRPPQRGEANANAKLTLARVWEIRKRYASKQFTQKQLGMEYGVCRAHISSIVRGESWGNE